MRWRALVATFALMTVLPLAPAVAQTNPLGTSYGSISARGCYMTYRLAPTTAGELTIDGSISCAESPYYFEQMSVTILDNGQAVDPAQLSGDPGCAFATGASAVGCRLTAQRGHVYSVIFDFYIDGAENSSFPYPHDPLNAGTCSSNPFVGTEIQHLSCSATLHYTRTQ